MHVRFMISAALVSGCVAGVACDDKTTEKASRIQYDGAESGLSAPNVQAAIDELAAGQGQPDAAGSGSTAKRVGDLEATVADLQSQLAIIKGDLGDVKDAMEALANVSAAQVGFDDSTTGLGADNTQGAFEQLVTLVVEQKMTIETQGTALKAQAQQISELEDKLSEATAGLDEKVGAPRPCPEGMTAVGPLFCIEPTKRPAKSYDVAAAKCHVDGRRLCTTTELMSACGAIDPILPEKVGAVAEWSGDAVGRLPVSDGSYYQIETLAFGGIPGCNSADSAGTSEFGEGTTTVLFPYRCCVGR